MKKILAVCVLFVLLLSCADAMAGTVGTDISADDIVDFYYTYNWVGYNAEYQRYRFYVEDEKYFFFHETRGTEDDYGWNTEEDILTSGTKELSREEWEALFAVLKDGTVTGRSEEVEDGDVGPWMYLYWKGDEGVSQEYTFASPAAESAFVDLCEELERSMRNCLAEDAETYEASYDSVDGDGPALRPVTVPGRTEDQAELLLPRYEYELASVHQVDGRQGIAWENGGYWVSGSTSLSRYDGEWNLAGMNESPFEGIDGGMNHIGDIDVYGGELFAGLEYFSDGTAQDIRIAVYDAGTLELKRCYAFEPSSGQTEVSGIAVDPDHRIIWMCSWADGETGRYLYKYALDDGAYLGKVHLQSPPQWLQGVAYHDGFLYLTADDGTADLGEPDHLYRGKADPGRTSMTVTLERTFDDVTMQGEIEGLSFDRENDCLLISYNRGAQVVLGMPMGFYEGYEEEIHEVFIYAMAQRDR